MGEETFVLRQKKLVILSSCNKRPEALGNILAGVKALHHRRPGRGHSGTTLKRVFKIVIFLEGKTQHSTATPFSCPLPSTCISCVLSCFTHVCVCSSCLHTGEPENTKHHLFSLFISYLKVSHNMFWWYLHPSPNSLQIHHTSLSTKHCVFFLFFFKPSGSICAAKMFLDSGVSLEHSRLTRDREK